jgi:hypothetical protein
MLSNVVQPSPRAKRLRYWLLGAATVAMLQKTAQARQSVGNGVASGNTSIAISDPAVTAATASGNASVAIGQNATASDSNTSALGTNSTASGFVSIALGYGIGNQLGSSALGFETVSYGAGSVAIGGATIQRRITCYVYLPIAVHHQPPNPATGYVEYGQRCGLDQLFCRPAVAHSCGISGTLSCQPNDKN